MTTLEMIQEFGTLKDLYQAPYYDTADILMFLNHGAISFVDERYPYAAGTEKKFQKNQRTVDDIHTLIKSQDLAVVTLGTAAMHPLAKAHVVLPTDYRHFETCRILFSGVAAKKVTTITYDELNLLEQDPFSVPNNTDNVYLCWHSGKILIISTSAPSTFTLIYCKNPIKITEAQNCDLPVLSHDKIVKIAVLEAIAIAEEERRAKLSPLLATK